MEKCNFHRYKQSLNLDIDKWINFTTINLKYFSFLYVTLQIYQPNCLNKRLWHIVTGHEEEAQTEEVSMSLYSPVKCITAGPETDNPWVYFSIFLLPYIRSLNIKTSWCFYFTRALNIYIHIYLFFLFFSPFRLCTIFIHNSRHFARLSFTVFNIYGTFKVVLCFFIFAWIYAMFTHQA